MIAQQEEKKKARIIDANSDWCDWRKRLRESFRYHSRLQPMTTEKL
jgi:hypothetical protein